MNECVRMCVCVPAHELRVAQEVMVLENAICKTICYSVFNRYLLSTNCIPGMVIGSREYSNIPGRHDLCLH